MLVLKYLAILTQDSTCNDGRIVRKGIALGKIIKCLSQGVDEIFSRIITGFTNQFSQPVNPVLFSTRVNCLSYTIRIEYEDVFRG